MQKFSSNPLSFLPSHLKKVFFVGIGGISMSSLAFICQKFGFFVGGSDTTATPLTEKLASSGMEIFYNHDQKNVHGYDVLVYTSAVKPTNPEVVFAKNSGIPVFSRAEFLGRILSAYPRRIGVSGMHGKSTTTAMLAEIFTVAGEDPTVLCGANMTASGGAYLLGNSENVIFEACEYCNSFLSFEPSTAVILNIELEHTDFFKSIENVKEAFAVYLKNSENAVVFLDDENVAEVVKNYTKPLYFFSITHADATFFAKNIKIVGGRTKFELVVFGESYGEICLPVFGEHNVLNALAAAAAAYANGIKIAAIKMGLESFRGVKRRFEFIGKLNGADLFEDYAHHPTEIKTTIKTAKSLGYSKIFCAFQPHTFSRTAAFFDDFADAFLGVDEVIFADIFSAREVNTFGVDSRQLACHTKNGVYIASQELLAARLIDLACANTAIIIMGAGDLGNIKNKLDFSPKNCD